MLILSPNVKGKYVSEHGGLLIYLHVDFEYDILEDIIGHTTGWEQLFLKIRHEDPNSKKYIIGNVYRVPNEIVGSCNCFTVEFSNLLTHLLLLLLLLLVRLFTQIIQFAE